MAIERRESREWWEETPRIEVELPERETQRFYAVDGSVLFTISDKPPVGFHQGERSTHE